MRKNRYFYLVQEYRATQEKLNDIEKERLRIQARVEIDQRLRQELEWEKKKAEEVNDKKEAEHWHNIIEKYYNTDDMRPSEEETKKAAEKIPPEVENLIVYYEAKLRIIKKLLGTRYAELVDIYDEKNMLMGIGAEPSSAKLIEDIEKDEEDQSQLRQRKKGFTFDKM